SSECNFIYNAACCMAMASAADDPSESGSSADRRARQKRDADRAVALLKKAIDLGLSNPSLPRSDSDLDAIRQRDDFQALIRKMEAKTKTSAEDERVNGSNDVR